VSGQIVEVHVTAAGGVVQPAIAVFLDENGGGFHWTLPHAAVHKDAGIS
jgi:hypothetical protein